MNDLLRNERKYMNGLLRSESLKDYMTDVQEANCGNNLKFHSGKFTISNWCFSQLHTSHLELAHDLPQHGPIGACLTSTVAALLTRSEVPLLKVLVLAGEPVTQKVVSVWGPAGLDGFLNCYGPAECTIYCSSAKQLNQSADRSPSNIGHALSSLRLDFRH